MNDLLVLGLRMSAGAIVVGLCVGAVYWARKREERMRARENERVERETEIVFKLLAEGRTIHGYLDGEFVRFLYRDQRGGRLVLGYSYNAICPVVQEDEELETVRSFVRACEWWEASP